MPITATKNHFSSAAALHKFTPSVLCEFLANFPTYMRQHGVELPSPHAATPKNMPYQAICAACMATNIDPDFNRILFFATKLGDANGYAVIQDQMAFRSIRPTMDYRTCSYADIPLLVWLSGRESHSELLEQSYASLNIHSKSAYRYYAPTRDRRKEFKPLNDETRQTLVAELADHFTGDPANLQVKVIEYSYEHEIWYMIRYPGHPIKPDAMTADGKDADASYTPGHYDAVVYHKTYGDLRLNTVRKKDHQRYRISFGHALLDEENAFDPTRQLITLAPLRGECAHLFHDQGPYPRLLPVEISYFDIDQPGLRTTLRAMKKDGDLLRYRPEHRMNSLTPETVDAIQYAKLRYKLDESSAWHNLTIHQGMDLSFERDGDSMLLEEWLRDHGFILNALRA